MEIHSGVLVDRDRSGRGQSTNSTDKTTRLRQDTKTIGLLMIKPLRPGHIQQDVANEPGHELQTQLRSTFFQL